MGRTTNPRCLVEKFRNELPISSEDLRGADEAMLDRLLRSANERGRRLKRSLREADKPGYDGRDKYRILWERRYVTSLIERIQDQRTIRNLQRSKKQYITLKSLLGRFLSGDLLQSLRREFRSASGADI